MTLRALAFIAFFSLFGLAHGENLVRDFELYKLNEGDKRAPTLLLVGGIHGDEAGAYYATDVFLRHYRVSKGSVWVVPVANPHGMFASQRGVYGDMNRKFAALSENDPDYASIQALKKLLGEKEIDISMHLHDGSGYWRPTYHNALFNQHRWGNCSVVDQPRLEGAQYGEIEGYVAQMVADINEHILAPSHRYHVHNTHTKAKNDIEQLKALTFFSLSLGKPALTNEASKELSIPVRVFYHLLAIESLLGQLGIEFERDFELSPKRLEPLITPPPSITIEQNITLPLHALRPHIGYLPMPKKSLKTLELKSQNELENTLLGVVRAKNSANTSTLELKYGSRTLTSITPEWREFDTSLATLRAQIDGRETSLKNGEMIYLKENVRFEPLGGYRVNVIGFTPPNVPKGADEAGFEIRKKDLLPQYSLDKNATIYRAEVYKGEKFSGMVLLSFEPQSEQRASKPSQWQKITYTPAPNSPLGKKLALAQQEQIKQERLKKEQARKKREQEALALNTPKDTQSPKATISESSPKSHSESSSPKQEPQTPKKPIEQPKAPQKPTAQVELATISSPNGVNIRQSPSTSAPIIAKLAQNTPLKVLERGEMWSKVAHSPYFSEGYVISKALQTSPDSEKTLTLSESSPQSQAEAKAEPKASSESSSPKAPTTSQAPKSDGFIPNAKVKVSTAFVRISPSETSAFIAKAPMGREVQVLGYVGEKDKWAKIHYVFVGKDGAREIRGYIAARLLSPLAPSR